MPDNPLEMHDIPRDRHVLIAGPTASGKSALALGIAQDQGGTIVNADALQVYACWRLITARPSPAEDATARHTLYGHIACDAPYSVGHWLREVEALLGGDDRLIVVGGTGLYFAALTEGLSAVPEVPQAVRSRADDLSLTALLDGLDDSARAGLDIDNRARVQRAWEVLAATGRPLQDWHKETATPLLALLDVTALCVMPDRERLRARIATRFHAMLEAGALAEVAAMQDRYDPSLPAFRAIGVPELMAHLQGEIGLEAARDRAIIASQQYAKRQRTWMRARMRDWTQITPA